MCEGGGSLQRPPQMFLNLGVGGGSGRDPDSEGKGKD